MSEHISDYSDQCFQCANKEKELSFEEIIPWSYFNQPTKMRIKFCSQECHDRSSYVKRLMESRNRTEPTGKAQND